MASDPVPQGVRSNQRGIVLGLLEEGPKTSDELHTGAGHGYRQRISELRQMGMDIECNTTTWPSIYILHRRPRPEPAPWELEQQELGF